MRTASIISLAAACVLFLDLIAARADVPVRVIRFDDIKPAGATLDSTFEAIGLDPQERVYATLCNSNEFNGDCYLFRWNPKTGKRQYLGSLVQSAKRVGNIGPNKYWPKKEVIVKGHTHNVYLDGQIWMGTMNVHGYENLAAHRGIHIFGFDLATGVLTDHAQWQPKGVFGEHSGIYALTAYPEKNLLVGLKPVDCTIITYNPHTKETTYIPGKPKEDNPQLAGRGAVVLEGGKLLYQCGSATTPLALYNINTGENKVLSAQAESVLTTGYVPTWDRKKAYVADLKNLYEFDVGTEILTKLTTMDPAGGQNQTSDPMLSLDEKKLYYVINMAGGEPGPYVDDLYEYNLETDVRTKIMNLKSVMEPSKISGTHTTTSNGKIYAVFNVVNVGIIEDGNVGIIEIDVSGRTGPKPGVGGPTATFTASPPPLP